MHHPSGVPSGCLGCIKAKAKAKPSTSSTDERRRCMGTAMASGDGWTGLSLLGCLQGDETLVTKLLEKEALSHTLIVCKAYIIFIYLLWTQNDWSPRTSFPNSSTLLPSNHSPQVRHKKYFEGGGFDYKLMTCFWPTLEKFWKTHTHTQKSNWKKKHLLYLNLFLNFLIFWNFNFFQTKNHHRFWKIPRVATPPWLIPGWICWVYFFTCEPSPFFHASPSATMSAVRSSGNQGVFQSSYPRKNKSAKMERSKNWRAKQGKLMETSKKNG